MRSELHCSAARRFYDNLEAILHRRIMARGLAAWGCMMGFAISCFSEVHALSIVLFPAAMTLLPMALSCLLDYRNAIVHKIKYIHVQQKLALDPDAGYDYSCFRRDVLDEVDNRTGFNLDPHTTLRNMAYREALRAYGWDSDVEIVDDVPRWRQFFRGWHV